MGQFFAGSHVLAVPAGKTAQIRRKADRMKASFLPLLVDQLEERFFQRIKRLSARRQFFLGETDKNSGGVRDQQEEKRDKIDSSFYLNHIFALLFDILS